MIRKVFYLITLVLAASVDSQALTPSVPTSMTVPVIWTVALVKDLSSFKIGRSSDSKCALTVSTGSIAHVRIIF